MTTNDQRHKLHTLRDLSRIIAAGLACWLAAQALAGGDMAKSCFDFKRVAYEDVGAANRAFAACYPRGTAATELLPLFKQVGEPTSSGYPQPVIDLVLYHREIVTRPTNGTQKYWDISLWVAEDGRIFDSLVTLSNQGGPLLPVQKAHRGWLKPHTADARAAMLTTLNGWVTPARIEHVMSETGATNQRFISIAKNDGVLRLNYTWNDPSLLGLFSRHFGPVPHMGRLYFIWAFDSDGRFIDLYVP